MPTSARSCLRISFPASRSGRSRVHSSGTRGHAFGVLSTWATTATFLASRFRAATSSFATSSRPRRSTSSRWSHPDYGSEPVGDLVPVDLISRELERLEYLPRHCQRHVSREMLAREVH